MPAAGWSRAWSAAAAAVAAVVLAACASQERGQVEERAQAFAAAAAAGDTATGCSLLAPATSRALEHDAQLPCGVALGGERLGGGRVQSVEVWGDAALVRLSDDTLFLTRMSGGWKVAAAGCTPNGDAPYDCREGP
jgi:hypothetical protein